MSLHDSCPQIEAATPGGMLPSAARWQRAAQDLDAVAQLGDVETQNAMEAYQRAVDKMASDPPSGQPYLNAFDAITSALQDLSVRCKAVGSSAFQ